MEASKSGLRARRVRSRLRLRVALAAAVIAGLCLPSAASASQKVSAAVKFSPYKLGASTTLRLGFHIASTEGGLPSPLTHITAVLPEDLGFAGSTLGAATCSEATLKAHGPSGCPSDAVVGVGTAAFEVPFGPEILNETTYVTTLVAPGTGTHTNLLVYAEGRQPIAASVVFTGELHTGRLDGESGTLFETTVPLVPAAPGGPDVSILRFETTFGPAHLNYYRYVHGKRVRYSPVGMTLPDRCPRGGFHFAASFAFADGTTIKQRLLIPCPSPAKSASRVSAHGRH
jgi:hypothetical protein